MQGVQEFLAWFEVQHEAVQWVVIAVGFLFLIVCARTASRWLGGKR